MLQQIAFIILTIISIYIFIQKAKKITRNILLGKKEDFSDNKKERWRNVFLLALGQKKMFKNPLVAAMHLIIYAGFIIINVEIIEIILDGILGSHRLFAPVLGKTYSWFINGFEILALGVLVVCFIFLIRRNWLKITRFLSTDLVGWPKRDANYILLTEIVLMSLFLTMNAADTLLQSKGVGHYFSSNTGSFIISSLLYPLLYSLSTKDLVTLERCCWWLHIGGIYAFLNYLPYSKHLHIVLAFPNAYFAKLNAQGVMQNMVNVQNEVIFAMQPELAPIESNSQLISSFGAKDIKDLSWKSLLDAYSCTECGRCSSVCPANISGKILSPRAIMMKTRDRVEEISKAIDKNGKYTDDEKSLIHHYISVEELRACTTCNACVEACPVSISPLNIIYELRRSLIMEESNAPQEWNTTFSNIENNFAPWKFNPDERDKWAVELAEI